MPNDVPQQHPLDAVADSLFRGDWRQAVLDLSRGGDTGGHPELLDVHFALGRVAESMRLQSAVADVEGARGQLDAARDRLLRHRESNPVFPEPRPDRHVAHLLWRTSRLVQRELADLEAVRRIFEDLPRGRHEMIYACVEHLTLVEFDPWTVSVHPRDRALTRLDKDAYGRWRLINRRDICARATRLRQFADVHRGSVNERSWQRMGGCPVVREQALRVLAREPETRGRTDLEVRLGRRRAWSYARGWFHDTVA